MDDYIQVDSELEEEFYFEKKPAQKKTTTKTKVVERKPKQQKGSKSWKERNADPESRIGSFDNDAIKEYFQLGVSKEDRYRIVTI